MTSSGSMTVYSTSEQCHTLDSLVWSRNECASDSIVYSTLVYGLYTLVSCLVSSRLGYSSLVSRLGESCCFSRIMHAALALWQRVRTTRALEQQEP